MENKAEKKGTAQLTINGKTHDLPVLGGSIGPDVIDIRALYKNAGVFTFDPGFTSTASSPSPAPGGARNCRSRCRSRPMRRSGNWPETSRA